MRHFKEIPSSQPRAKKGQVKFWFKARVWLRWKKPPSSANGVLLAQRKARGLQIAFPSSLEQRPDNSWETLCKAKHSRAEVSCHFCLERSQKCDTVEAGDFILPSRSTSSAKVKKIKQLARYSLDQGNSSFNPLLHHEEAVALCNKRQQMGGGGEAGGQQNGRARAGPRHRRLLGKRHYTTITSAFQPSMWDKWTNSDSENEWTRSLAFQLAILRKQQGDI